jgi:dipeptide/tripeptide permease
LICSYSVFVAGVKAGEVELRAGGVYSVLVDEDNNVNKLFLIFNLFCFTIEFFTCFWQKLKSYLVTPESSVNMLWLIPQYFVITAGEVMFSITGLEFAFTQVRFLQLIL